MFRIAGMFLNTSGVGALCVKGYSCNPEHPTIYNQ